jgi:ATP-dependent Clp protease ATP-binding subunit ClpB
MADVKGHFRPEFLNRLDETILFSRLSEEDLEEIVRIQIARLGRLLDGRRITVELTPNAERELARRGYDPAYGARPLKRVIMAEIQNALAMKLLTGDIQEGDTVSVDGDEQGFTFTRMASA